MIFLAPAKINLTLKITGKDKKDGYHFIESVFDPVSLYDILDIEQDDAGRIRFDDADKKLKISRLKNIAYEAAVMLQKASRTRKGAVIKLYKRIPHGAGLGGGSSDAAAVLLALNRLWRLKYSLKKLAKLAFKLGSDVPFFIYEKPARVSGKGEKIAVFNKRFRNWYVIIVKKGVKISTPHAYSWFDADKKLTLGRNADILNPRLMREPKHPSLYFPLFNDFESTVFRRKPVLKNVKEVLLKCGNAKGACLSGSGAAVFALFKNRKEALACFRKARRIFRGSFICLAHSL